MNVRELIERLQRCDPDLPVRIAYKEPGLPNAGTVLDAIVSVGTDNAPRAEVLISNRDIPLILPR